MHLQVDVWSLGVVLYAGLVGRPPFETADVRATYKRIQANDYCFPDAVPLSDDAKHLVRWALSPAPEHRPTLAQMLSHPFVVANRTRPVRRLRHRPRSYPTRRKTAVWRLLRRCCGGWVSRSDGVEPQRARAQAARLPAHATHASRRRTAHVAASLAHTWHHRTHDHHTALYAQRHCSRPSSLP
jgi:serine/threonine protein kinase